MVFVQVALDRLDSRGSKVADYLLVIDMQSDYVAVGKAYHEELIAAVNDKIASYPSDRVIYILNRFFWERKDRKKKFATGLLLVSSRIFEKRRASCFTNSDLKDFLEGNGAKSIEFIGVDGNGCVKASILAAVKSCQGELSGFCRFVRCRSCQPEEIYKNIA